MAGCIGLFTDSQAYLELCKKHNFVAPITYTTLNSWTISGGRVPAFPPSEFFPYYGEVLRRVEKIRPVIARHFDSEPKRDLLNRDIAIQILSIMSSLQKNGINKVIFTTNSSHWLDSQMLEIACAVLKIPQIFLYAIWLDGRIVPMIQVDGIESRKRLSETISPIQFEENILRIASLGFRNFFSSDWKLSTNKFLAYFRPIKFHCRIFIHTTLRELLRRIPRNEHFGGRRIGILSELRLVANQIKAVRVLKMYIRVDSKKNLPADERALIIFAHYQPEATTFPEAGQLWNHIDLVIKLKMDHPDVSVYYKEHPDMFAFVDTNNSTRGGVARSKNYYNHLRALGVKFLQEIPTSVNCIPVTMNGTVAVERSLAGLPTIVGGYPWYQGLPGTYSLEELKQGGLEKLSSIPNDSIREEAEAYLCEILNNKTVTNITGISGFHPKKSSKDHLLHEQEILNLIHKLLKL